MAGEEVDGSGSSEAGTWKELVAEAAISVFTVVAFLLSCLLIRVQPVDRLGQISALAYLGLRFIVTALLIVGGMLYLSKIRDGRHRRLAIRLGCASAAALASALVGGGILVALRGTPFGINATFGDMGKLGIWAGFLNEGKEVPGMYPPLPLHFLARYSQVLSIPPQYAIKHLQIFGTAAFGPVAYLCWRKLMSAPWALAMTVVLIFPLIEPYKPYPNLVLVAFVPLTIRFLQTVRDVKGFSAVRSVRSGVLFGVGFGVLFLMYSGWYQWAAPGVIVAATLVFPWRDGRRLGLIFVGVTTLTFLLVSLVYLISLFGSEGVVDGYIYFDVLVDPAYIAMWRNDVPGAIVTWPPLGEFAGVSLYTIFLAAAFGGAVALGRRTVELRTLVSMMLGAWLMRFLFARKLWETHLVQLFPRTTPLILACLLAMVVLTFKWLHERSSSESWTRQPAAFVGAMCGLLFLAGSAGSALTDRWMPSQTDTPTPASLTYNAHSAYRELRPKKYSSYPMSWMRRSLESVPSQPAPMEPVAPHP